MLSEAISRIIGNDYIATLLMSIIPLIELKGGIIFARTAGFGFFQALGLGYLGSSLAFFPAFFLFRPILELLKKTKIFRKLALKIESYFSSRADDSLGKEKIANEGVINIGVDGTASKTGENDKIFTKKGTKKRRISKKLAVFLFVAIPLPMTGVWTGTVIALFLKLKFKEALPTVLLGNAVAGILISLLGQACLSIWKDIKVLDYILYALFGLAVVIFVIVLIRIFTKKVDKTQTNEDNIGK